MTGYAVQPNVSPALPACYQAPECLDCGCSYVNPAQLRSFMVSLCKPEQFPLAEQTVERSSRLFDDAVGAPHGYFQLAGEHATIKTLLSPGGKYLPLPLHLPGSVCSVHSRFGVYPRNRWAETEDGSYLILDYNVDHIREINISPDSCNCSPCGSQEWAACVSVVARWGMPCIPGDIEQAVLEYAGQAFRRREPVAGVVNAVGGDPFIAEQAPLSWKIAVGKWRSHLRKRRSRFA